MKTIKNLLLATSIAILAACKEDPNEAAMRLLDETEPFWQHAQSMRGTELEQRSQRLSALRIVHGNIEKILADYPDSELAQLLGPRAQNFNMSLPTMEREIAELQRAIQCTEDAMSCLVEQAVIEFNAIQESPAEHLTRAGRLAPVLTDAERPDLALQILRDARRTHEEVAARVGLLSPQTDMLSYRAEIAALVALGRMDEAQDLARRYAEIMDNPALTSESSLQDRLKEEIGIAGILHLAGDDHAARGRITSVAARLGSLDLFGQIEVLTYLSRHYLALGMTAEMNDAGALAAHLLEEFRTTDFRRDEGADFRFGGIASVLAYSGRIDEGMLIRDITREMSSKRPATFFLDALVRTEQYDDAIALVQTTQSGKIYLSSLSSLMWHLIRTDRADDARSLFPRLQIAAANEDSVSSIPNLLRVARLADELGYLQIADNALHQAQLEALRDVHDHGSTFFAFEVFAANNAMGRMADAATLTDALEAHGHTYIPRLGLSARHLRGSFSALMSTGNPDGAFEIAARLAGASDRLDLITGGITDLSRLRQMITDEAS